MYMHVNISFKGNPSIYLLGDSDYKKERLDAIKADSLKLLQTGLLSIHVLIYYSLIYVTVSFLKISFRIT